MSMEHLTEHDIQQYAAAGSAIPDSVAQHLETCPQCRLQVANYQLLFAGIQEQPVPAFDFDVAALVMDQLPVTKQEETNATAPRIISPQPVDAPTPQHIRPSKRISWGMLLTVLSALLLCAIPIGLLWPWFVQTFHGAPTILLLPLGVSAICILAFQQVELFSQHKKQMRRLNMS